MVHDGLARGAILARNHRARFRLEMRVDVPDLAGKLLHVVNDVEFPASVRDAVPVMVDSRTILVNAALPCEERRWFAAYGLGIAVARLLATIADTPMAHVAAYAAAYADELLLPQSLIMSMQSQGGTPTTVGTMVGVHPFRVAQRWDFLTWPPVAGQVVR